MEKPLKEFFISMDMPSESAIKEFESIVIEVNKRGKEPVAIVYYQRKDGSTSDKAVVFLKKLKGKKSA